MPASSIKRTWILIGVMLKLIFYPFEDDIFIQTFDILLKKFNQVVKKYINYNLYHLTWEILSFYRTKSILYVNSQH